MNSRLNRLVAVAVLLLLPLLLFWPSLLGGQAFLPADLLSHLSPWKTSSPPYPWNVLRFDGITEFYPWRLITAESFQAGRIPLWNPYSFAGTGGIPLLANSQSAPLYPPNILFWLMPPGTLWYAFGLSAALHLGLLVVGMYRLLRARTLSRPAALLGATVIGFSGPVITWLSLPTFLCVAAWTPWLLLLIHRTHELCGTRTGNLAALGAAGVAGMMLLAGHLQMAFYGLLAGGLYALWCAPKLLKRTPVRWLAGTTGIIGIAVLLALPQLLPAVELSRVSHRAATGPPTMDTYSAYIANALPVRNLVTLAVPDFFGHPLHQGGLYWNTNNYAEWATYIGIAPFVLAIYALLLPWRGPKGFFALLVTLSLLLAFGTPLNLPLFFLVPGYSQTGNPARCLFITAFALAALAAMGLDALLHPGDVPKPNRNRAAFGAVVIAILLSAIGASAAARFAAEKLAQVPFGELMTAAQPGILKAGLLGVIATICIVVVPNLSAERRRLGVGLVLLLTAADLLSWGQDYNPTAPLTAVYPVTPGIAFLQQNASPGDLIAPINTGWSMSSQAPRNSVLPPNALAVYGLHDLQGYDSLLPGAAKRHLETAEGMDPSPPENGNMAFVKSIAAARTLGARFIVLPPNPPDAMESGLRSVYAGDDVRILEVTDASTRQTFDSTVGRAYQPTSFRFGLFGGLCATGFLASGFVGSLIRRRRRDLRSVA